MKKFKLFLCYFESMLSKYQIITIISKQLFLANIYSLSFVRTA